MLLTLLLALAGVVASTARSYDYGIDIDQLIRRQDPAAKIIVGKLPLASNGSTPIRPEIRDMRKNGYMWDLYILALSMFQSVGQDQSLSWYQIAGIHGVPFQPWNGVQPAPGASQSGYCTHSSVLFPLWHRPYLALYEQQMFKLANAIAGLFTNATERNLYQQAASRFRIPYWDWSLPAPPGETHFPDCFWSPVILQYGPNGLQHIRNPLFSYMFHPVEEDAFIWNPLKRWSETKRAPNMTVSETAPPSENFQVSAALLSKLPELQQRLYIIFSNYHEFNAFSNKAWASSQKASNLDSLESIHDIIHLYGGLKGHMTVALQQSLVRKINTWYGASSPAGIAAKDSQLRVSALEKTGGLWSTKASKGVPNIKLTATDPPSDKIVKAGAYTEWIANVQVNVEALEGVFDVHFFVGAPADNPTDWTLSPNQIGTVAIFAMNHSTGSQSKISGTLPLTTALMKLVATGTLPNLDPSAVTPFLRRTLEVRVRSHNDSVVDLARVEGLHIEISSTCVKVPASDVELPTWGDSTLELTVWRDEIS
ncbi:tyrosinase precursor [Cordyceps fumosorosea ARSEF 2679]|uniref:Tyrosinase n=1 Tax=Cordyceps fumosorosea (strain ARSEF 2679) TaxID=1081104 RepID=A0A167RLD3_CORFA|nr:tyrosinase precursor [Cordyceps fumosorosea ARSEF 2679]OAA58708.1 tyrosinase precursor [Cordyceps fumosorosea ARSEF 2679]